MYEPPQGVKISAYLFFANAVLTLLGMCGLLAFIPIALSDAGSSDTTPIMISMGGGACVLLILVILYAAVGYGLLKLQSWARIAAIVLAILSLCSFPLGTIIGGVVLYFMFQPEATKAFS